MNKTSLEGLATCIRAHKIYFVFPGFQLALVVMTSMAGMKILILEGVAS